MTRIKSRRESDKQRKKRKRWWALVAVIAFVIASLLLLDRQMRPIIESMASYQAKVYALKSLNQAMITELEEHTIRYDDIVQITRNQGGEVTSVQTDMLEVNRLKSRITQIVVEQLENQQNQVVRIPIGTLLGNQLTSGRGPLVEIRIVPTGYVQTDIYNQFVSAGINQTLHQIMLSTSVQMIAIVPGYTVRTETSTNFCIAETVIVGAIPEGFTQIHGDDGSTISKINDYSAKPAG